MRLTLKIWRQADAADKGRMVGYRVDDADEDMSFLELLDVLNEKLILSGDEPVAFDHDCREGICGSCSMVINGHPHGPQKATTACQLHLRHFRDGETITIEPWRAAAFPVIKDLVVDRSAFDRIIQAGGYVSAPTGSAPDAPRHPGPEGARRPRVHRGCLHRLPARAWRRARTGRRRCSSAPRSPTSASSRRASPSVTAAWFGWWSSTTPRASAAAPTPARARCRCPKEIPLDVISQLNHDYIAATSGRRRD